jgi:hypothetical protein
VIDRPEGAMAADPAMDDTILAYGKTDPYMKFSWAGDGLETKTVGKSESCRYFC